MKVKATTDLVFDGKKFETGSVFEAGTEHSLTLIGLGWVEAVEDKKTPKKTAKKKK